MAFRSRFPLAGHRRALHFGVHDVDEANSLLCRLDAAAAAGDETALQQNLDDLRARGRRPQAALLHRVGEFLVVKRFAGRLHSGEQRGVGEALGRLGSFGNGFDIDDGLRLTLGEIGQRQFVAVGFAGDDVENFPSRLADGGTTGAEAVVDRAANQRDDRGGEPDVVFMPGGEQPAADEVEDFPLVRL